ncbi:MAG: COX15/CtaA family protein [Alphaproteobacteria bacterium]
MHGETGVTTGEDERVKLAGGPARGNGRLVRFWLYAVAALVVLMVLVGGATRLTDSGLSITEWKPVTGAVPPFSEATWLAEFDKYKAIPEYRLVNRGMSLAQFKTIYWWEWGHRFLGRLIGLAFAVPFAMFLLTGHLRRRHVPVMGGLLLLGGLQGAVGWWMVASGLVERVDVSQYRLAVHLTLASFIFASLIAVAATFERPRDRTSPMALPVRASTGLIAGLIIALVFAQIFAGGLVAGLDAGMAYNSWPLMDGRIVPGGLLVMEPAWRNFFENALTVQFAHRMVAYGIVLLVFFHAVQLRRSGNPGAARRALWLVAAVLVQVALGIATLVAQVPTALALAHQAGAMVLLGIAVGNGLAGRRGYLTRAAHR